MFCRVCGYSLAEPPTRREAGADLVPLPAPVPTPLAGAVTAPIPAPVRMDAPIPVPQIAVPLPVPSPSPMAPRAPVVAPAVAAPAPAPPASPVAVGRAVLLERDGSDGQAWPLAADVVDIGAKEGTILIESDPFLSSRHARLSCERAENGAASWQVIDLESVNGVYVRLRSKVSLSDGDLILLGQQVLRFDVVKDAEHGLGPATQHGTAIFGTPPASRLARLCQRTVEGITRDVFHIHRAETSLGRETADIVFTDDPFLSRRHAVITHDPTTRRFFIEDAGSSNGTYVAIRGRAPIGHGDILRMGLHVLRIELPATTSETARS
jgi:pSer/pThr/pTyr-binding forkhead associated (FHA) protein